MTDTLQVNVPPLHHIVDKGEGEGKYEKVKDERHYRREERALKRVEVITKLKIYMEEA